MAEAALEIVSPALFRMLGTKSMRSAERPYSYCDQYR